MDSPLLVFIVQVFGGIAVLVAPIVVYSRIDRTLTQRAVDSIGKDWCTAHGKEFLHVERWKNHFSLVYGDGSATARKKFIAKFRLFTWSVSGVTWLAK